MIDDAIRFFRRHVRSVWRIEGSRRIEVPEYPEGVIRELLINAVIHRSYLEGRDVTFQIFSDRVVMASPGCVPPPLTLEDLRAPVGPPSVRRNPLIADAFARLERMELRAIGLPAVYEGLRRHGLRKPEFREHANPLSAGRDRDFRPHP
ncbi:MAG: ATP-binding protein [Acidobacteriota bacterium]